MEKKSTYKPNTSMSHDEFPDEETSRKYVSEVISTRYNDNEPNTPSVLKQKITL